MAASFTFKRGSTFAVVVMATDDATGDPYDLTGCTIASQLRDSLGNLVATLTAAPASGFPGAVLLSTAEATTAWPLSLLSCDVQVTESDGTISATETFTVQVVQQVTQ
jgi:hypothetical protein